MNTEYPLNRYQSTPQQLLNKLMQTIPNFKNLKDKLSEMTDEDGTLVNPIRQADAYGQIESNIYLAFMLSLRANRKVYFEHNGAVFCVKATAEEINLTDRNIIETGGTLKCVSAETLGIREIALNLVHEVTPYLHLELVGADNIDHF